MKNRPSAFWLLSGTITLAAVIASPVPAAEEGSPPPEAPVSAETAPPAPGPVEEVQPAAAPADAVAPSRETVPSSPRLKVHYFYRKGLEALEKKDYQSASESFQEVLKLNPNYRRAAYYYQESWSNLASEGIGRQKAETEAVEQVADREAYDAYARGKEYMRNGQYEAAIKEFQEVLRVNPEHQGARELLGEARLKLEKSSFEKEVAEAQKVMEEEETLRSLAREEEERAVKDSYAEGSEFYQRGELEEAREKFTEVRKKQRRYRRTPMYLKEIETKLEEQRELSPGAEEEEAIRKYTLGPDDTVKVIVRNHPEFSFDAMVEEGGELIIPLTNEIIMAKGLNRDELAEEIRKKLTAYIDNPFVNVFITNYASKKYYVLQPAGGGSEYVMDKANMTLWDCMFQAGIPTLGDAALRRIQVITPHRTHPTHRWVNVYTMLYQGKMEDNIRIEPGTIIYYPMLVIDKFDEIVKAITRPISTLASMGSSYERWDDFRKKYLK